MSPPTHSWLFALAVAPTRLGRLMSDNVRIDVPPQEGRVGDGPHLGPRRRSEHLDQHALLRHVAAIPGCRPLHGRRGPIVADRPRQRGPIGHEVLVLGHVPEGQHDEVGEVDPDLIEGDRTVREGVGRPRREGVEALDGPSLGVGRGCGGAAPRIGAGPGGLFPLGCGLGRRGRDLPFPLLLFAGSLLVVLVLVVGVIERLELLHDEIERVPACGRAGVPRQGAEVDLIPDVLVLRLVEEAVPE
mmetsp:Transcript_20337/g.58813  ORF Transcript_20337/g.58813 Transcript_20337/m.58813 type:complete len:244 (+) Transcript_20337:2754-3485(+)